MPTALLVMDFRAGVLKRFAGIGEDAPETQVVVKRRVRAFTGSDLEVVLRASDVDPLVLSGIATSGVVLSTLRQADVVTVAGWVAGLG